MKKEYDAPEMNLMRFHLEQILFSPSKDDITPGSGDDNGDLGDDEE